MLVYDHPTQNARLSLPATPSAATTTSGARLLIGQVIVPLRFLTKSVQVDGTTYMCVVVLLCFLNACCVEWFPLTARDLNTAQGDM
jgi:hypothetical protein